MRKLNILALILSIVLLFNIVFQEIYFRIVENGNGVEWITDVISFVGNFNFATMIILPFLLLIYSIFVLFAREKYATSLLFFSLINISLFFIF